MYGSFRGYFLFFFSFLCVYVRRRTPDVFPRIVLHELYNFLLLLFISPLAFCSKHRCLYGIRDRYLFCRRHLYTGVRHAAGCRCKWRRRRRWLRPPVFWSFFFYRMHIFQTALVCVCYYRWLSPLQYPMPSTRSSNFRFSGVRENALCSLSPARWRARRPPYKQQRPR